MKSLFIAMVLFAAPALACDMQVAFSPNQGALPLLLDQINSAQKSIHVAAYVLSSEQIISALEAAQNRGVVVKAVLDKRQKVRSYPFPVRLDRYHAIMHDKFMVIDQNIVTTGSFNFSKAAEQKNAENLLVLKDCLVTSAYNNNWESLWDAAGFIMGKTD